MQPFNIFDCNSSIEGKFFLEASAGTGKTFTIEQIILRALIEGSLTHIEHVLAITFTNASTNELKMRIKDNLSHSLKQLKEALNSQTVSLPRYLNINSNVKQIYMKIRNALSTLDQMSLFTIHGFCNFVLEQYFPGRRLIHKNPSLSHPQLILYHIRNYLKQDLWKNVLFVEQFHLLAVRYNVTSKYTSSLIDKLLTSYSQKVPSYLPPRSTTMKQITRWHQKIRPSLLDFPKQSFLEQLIALTSGFKKQPFSILDDLEHFVDLLYSSETHSTLFSFFKIAETFNFKHRLTRYKPCPAFTLLEEMSWIELTLQFCNLDTIFNTLLRDVQFHLKQNYTPWLSPDESVLALEKLLLSPEAQPVVDSIRKRYQLVLIDEFQDTDKYQWNIFSHLFLPDEFLGSLFLIGDPKQSIYEWRNADLPTYLKAKSSFSEDMQLQLINNYRATPKLMQAINLMFGKISPFLEIHGYPPIEYYPLNPQSTETFEVTPYYAPIHFFLYENIKDQALWIFSEAERLKKEQGIPLGQMVILVSDSKQAFELMSYATLPVAFSKNKSILHLTETYVLTIALLEAILYPENYEKISKILLSTLFGLSIDEVTSKKEKYTIYFQSLQTYILKYKFLATFYHIMCTQGEVLLKSSQGDLIFQEMEKLCGYLDTISSYPHHQLLHLKNFSETGMWEEELTISSYSEDLETLKITTIHSSKGLEYEVVFCPGIDRNKKNKSSSELLREMYVALTRAKKQLYLPISKQSSSLQKISALTNYVKLVGVHSSPYDLAIDLSQKYSELFSYSLSTQNKQITKTFSLPPLKTFSLKAPHPKTIFSFSSTKFMLDTHKDQQYFSPSKLLSKQQLPIGEKTGVLIHKILESIQFHLLQDADYLKSTVMRFVKHSHLEGFEDTIVSLISKTFFSPLPFASQTFSLSQISPNKMFRETPFLFLENDELWQGTIDLLFEYKGKYYIIDWKTSFLGETTSDYSATNIAIYIHQEKLDYQGKIYVKATKKFLSQFDINDDVEFGVIFIRGIDTNGNGFFTLKNAFKENLNFNPKATQKYQVYH
ncbi:Exodeoxyribonuclease V beta chain,exonuclease V subunit beta,Superfamily I DNA and RNA helicases,exodeoxyribonuclease V, beta subunit,UvrD/REP helicase [Chlamydia serpentis]|uniref:RecBCD enzyme subunit RecB n=1 Tax=Chlamydia serpentis TaxID=1967782 RepID=A0A2R8FBP1_9CHLA|nr:exodeoxyribonuclease V subunit beta [Chlamydia serpentis]SPN73855.1 Exodeoxyribonuclease V beta chain,exonuclease V subunit beta,Superfamily I DNA and RNA helicases,exodeoxyribonuclease V, beta subunit,UvrD/REP helicase [Chlamydia serpentis]